MNLLRTTAFLANFSAAVLILFSESQWLARPIFAGDEQDKRGSISGTIVGPDSKTGVGAVVTAVQREPDGSGSKTFTVRSDAKSAFKFASLPIGLYELRIAQEDGWLMRPFTTSVSVRESEETNVQIRLEPVRQCSATGLEKLTDADKAEIIKLMLTEALTRKGIPSYPTLVSGKEVILSTKNIDSLKITDPRDLKLKLLSPADIQAGANRVGDLMYLEFEEIEVRGSCVAVSLSNL